MKTDECKDLRLLPALLSPSNDTGIYLLFPFLSSSPHLYHVFAIHSGCLTTTLLHQTQTAMRSCSPAAYLHLFFFTPLFLYGPLELSVLRSTKQILFPLLLPKLHLAFWAWLRPGFVKKTQQPLLCSLTTSPFLTSPVSLGRVEVLVFSFLIIGNTQLILPYAIITHWNLMLLL